MSNYKKLLVNRIMKGIRKIIVGLVLLLVINYYGQGLAKPSNDDEFDLKAIETRKIGKKDRIWQQGIIPFIVKKSLFWESRRFIAKAIKFWEKKTCIKFIGYDKIKHKSFLTFIKTKSCKSPPGLNEVEKDKITVAKNCSYEVIVRKIGHALGFAFENDPEYPNLATDVQDDLEYRCPSCGETLQESGSFETPNYSNNSTIEGNDTNMCEWRITGASSDKIVLKIESMNIEKSPNCTTDYIEVRDGYNSESLLLGRYCGNEKELTINSTSDRMLVTYVKTSNKKENYGFKASYHKNCGGDINIDEDIIFLESPNYPFSYQPKTHCLWKLHYPKDKLLKMINYYLKLKDSKRCESDFLEEKDGFDLNSSVIARGCGVHNSWVTNMTGGSLQVEFYSENPEEDSGFSVLFRANAEKKPIKEIKTSAYLETVIDAVEVENSDINKSSNETADSALLDKIIKKVEASNFVNKLKEALGVSDDKKVNGTQGAPGAASHQSYSLVFLFISLILTNILTN